MSRKKKDTEAPRTTAAEKPAAERAEAVAAVDRETETPSPAAERDAAADLARELEQVTAELESLRDRWLRAVAEQDNLRKRTAREVVDARRFAQADLMRDLLEVMDNFERAAASVGGEEEDTTADWPEAARRYREGIELIRQHLWDVLAARGLSRIEAAPGTPFDPSLHEAVMQVPSEEHPEGAIVEVVQAGYRLGDLVVRPSRVVVAA